MNSRDAQDLVLRLLADGPFRSATFSQSAQLEAEAAAVVARVDRAGLDRFARFLCRHYYRERVVHYFTYSRALARLVGRSPEAVLKTPDFAALVPQLVLGERKSAERVLELLRRHLLSDAGDTRSAVPYWDDLVTYQSYFFLSDAVPPAQAALPYPARAATAAIVELGWNLPKVLPSLLRPFRELPMPPQEPTTLLFARSMHGEVTVLRCTDVLQRLLERLTGRDDPSEIAAGMGLDRESFHKTMERLEQLGAVVAQESFSASHVGSEVSRHAGEGRS